MARYIAWNGPIPTTGPQLKVTTSAATKTMLQIATPATRGLSVVEWGASMDGSAAATPAVWELFETSVAATTMIAHVASGVPMFDTNDGLATQMTLGTGATAYSTTTTVENTPLLVRMFDAQNVAPSSGYVKQFPLGERPRMAASKFLRVRVTITPAVNALCYVVFDEM